MASINPARHETVTDRDIHKILGPLEDDIVMAIQDMGATREDIIQAYAWFDEEDYMGGVLEKPMTHRVRRVYDLLRDDLDRFERYER